MRGGRSGVVAGPVDDPPTVPLLVSASAISRVPAASTARAPRWTRVVVAASPAAPTDGPSVIDTRGRLLPAAAAEGARRLYSALTSDDQQVLRATYSPDRTVASWGEVRPRLAGQEVRAGLLEALRQPPSPRPEVAYLYSARGFGVGLTAAGRVAFFGTGQRPSATTSSKAPVPTGRARAEGGQTVPFACEDSVVGDGLDAPECDRPAAGSGRSSHCSADTAPCPAGYREGVVSRANPYGCDFDATSAENPCQWRYVPSAGGGADRPDPVTPAQRWAACRLSGLREFC